MPQDITRPAPPLPPDAPYVGRLAPSPTGRFHIGNLSTSALAAVRACVRGGRLFLRMEDLDTPRCVRGAEVAIVADLEWLGVRWDGDHTTDPELLQSRRNPAYSAALSALVVAGAAYPCFCSRRDIQEASAPHGPQAAELRYPGTCAGGSPSEVWGRAAREDHAIRFRMPPPAAYHDVVLGLVAPEALDDFVIRRRDGLFAYQLAVVVDDAQRGVTEVVRGRDLADSVPRQVALYAALGARSPTWCHVPLLCDAEGGRLAKRNGAVSRAGLQDAGWTGPSLLGAFACLWGWRDRLEPTSIDALSQEWDARTLAPERICVPDALFEGPSRFDAWVRRCGEGRDHTAQSPPGRAGRARR